MCELCYGIYGGALMIFLLMLIRQCMQGNIVTYLAYFKASPQPNNYQRKHSIYKKNT